MPTEDSRQFPLQSLIENLVAQLGAVRRSLVALTTVVAIALAAIVAHEVLVLISPPVPPVHEAVHLSMLVLASTTGAALWVFWRAYRVLAARQHVVADDYRKLDQTVQEKTRSLRSSESLLTCLFDAIEDRMVVVDEEGLIVHANRVAIAQAARPPLRIPFCEAFPDDSTGDERRSARRLIEYTFRTKVSHRNRLICSGNGARRLLALDTFPVWTSAGEIELVLVVTRDVTREKEDEAITTHHEKMAALGLLAAGVAHDLGNPLTSLSSELQLLKDEADARKIQDSLRTVERHIDRMVRTVRDILGFARKRSDRSATASIPSAISDAVRLLRHDPRARSVRFEIEVPQNLPTVAVREDDLVLVLLNVILNAIEAMPQGGLVQLAGTRLEGDCVQIRIRDTGIGMDANTLAKAASPLFTTKQAANGTGLGLAFANTLVRRVHGAFLISSVAGEGTTVTLRLPVRAPALDRRGSDL